MQTAYHRSQPSAVQDMFRKEFSKPDGGEDIICIDGKAMRGTARENGRNPDIMSAYSVNTGMPLSTEACPEKSYNIKAIPKLLDKLDIADQIVTPNAISMQKGIIDKIRERHADFIIELQAN